MDPNMIEDIEEAVSNYTQANTDASLNPNVRVIRNFKDQQRITEEYKQQMSGVEKQSNDELIDQMGEFVRTHMSKQIEQLIHEPEYDCQYPVTLDWMMLQANHMLLSTFCLNYPLRFLPLFDDALRQAQAQYLLITKKSYEQNKRTVPKLSVKQFIHTRLQILPPSAARRNVPHSSDYTKLIKFMGTVIRTGQVKVLEYERKMTCTKCKNIFTIYADVEQRNDFPKVEVCPNSTSDKQCTGKIFTVIDGSSMCRDYQDIKVQERIENVAIGAIPRTILVLLHDDLVDGVQAGDNVDIIGIPQRRWRYLMPNERIDIEMFIAANSIVVNNSNLKKKEIDIAVLKVEFEKFWNNYTEHPLIGRNVILENVCSQIYGLSIVKLAIMLVLIGGVPRKDPNGMKIRGQPHLLLVGDPGTGKSQFLKYAAKLSTRSVLTTGIGTTSAGLTVAAVKDQGGDWMLEAGALVLADGGICCIDEFDSISPHDRQTIHEAMEQQTISVAKAGLVCKLNTRAAVIAATNPKGKFDLEQTLTVNTALASPLLSRFDLILVLLDRKDQNWDLDVSNFVLYEQAKEKRNVDEEETNVQWTLEKLQTYINYVRTKFEPKLTANSERILTLYYQRQRSADSRNAARTTIRLLESLIRVAQAHARLMFRENVLTQDAVIAILLMEASNQNQPLFGNFKSALQSNFPTDPEIEYKEQEEIILNRLGLSGLSDADPLQDESTPLSPRAAMDKYMPLVADTNPVDDYKQNEQTSGNMNVKRKREENEEEIQVESERIPDEHSQYSNNKVSIQQRKKVVAINAPPVENPTELMNKMTAASLNNNINKSAPNNKINKPTKSSENDIIDDSLIKQHTLAEKTMDLATSSSKPVIEVAQKTNKVTFSLPKPIAKASEATQSTRNMIVDSPAPSQEQTITVTNNATLNAKATSSAQNSVDKSKLNNLAYASKASAQLRIPMQKPAGLSTASTAQDKILALTNVEIPHSLTPKVVFTPPSTISQPIVINKNNNRVGPSNSVDSSNATVSSKIVDNGFSEDCLEVDDGLIPAISSIPDKNKKNRFLDD